MRTMGTALGLAFLILTQFGVSYSAAVICSTSIPARPVSHCCIGEQTHAPSTDQCQRMCGLESEDSPVVLHAEGAQAYTKDTAISRIIPHKTEPVWLTGARTQRNGSLESLPFDLKIEVYLLNTSFLI